MHGPSSRAARLRGTVAVVATLGALAALGVLAGASWSATGSSSSHQYQYGTKVTICHHTHSKKNPQVTITVSQNAVKAHLKHGDTLGACPPRTKTKGKPGTTTTTTTTTTSTTSHGNGHGNGGNGGNGNGNGNGNGHGHGHK
jgi:hypothetical protein